MSHPKCILCRCEDVTLEEFREAYREGFTEFESLKRYTGVGTGICQGKSCLAEAALQLARLRGTSPSEIPLTTIRQPAEPLNFAQLAALPEPPPDRGAPASEETGPAGLANQRYQTDAPPDRPQRTPGAGGWREVDR
jgi:sarcosine oxidase subunit beta